MSRDISLPSGYPDREARSSQQSVVVGTLVVYLHKLLVSATADGLGSVDVALRVGHDRVRERELARHVAGPSDAPNQVATLSLKYPNAVAPEIHDEHERLLVVAGQLDVGSPKCRHHVIRRVDRDDSSKVPLSVENLNAILTSVARVHEPVVAEYNAAWVTTAPFDELSFTAPCRPPLTQVVPVLVEDDDPMVAIAVRDVDRATFARDRILAGIHRDIGRGV